MKTFFVLIALACIVTPTAHASVVRVKTTTDYDEDDDLGRDDTETTTVDTLYIAPGEQNRVYAYGEGGDDTLTAGDRDLARGGPGNDTVLSTDPAGARAADRLDGGRGSDTISYRTRRSAVTATLNGRGGAPGERDRLRHFERLLGSQGADHLFGTAGPDLIDGRHGADVVDARAGDDRVAPGAGDDITCGAGTDRMGYSFSRHILLRPDCERVHPYVLAGSLRAQPTAVTAGAVTMTLPCSTSQDTTDAARRVTLTSGATELGSTLRPLGDDSTRCATEIPLTDAAKALPHPLVVQIVFREDIGWQFVL